MNKTTSPYNLISIQVTSKYSNKILRSVKIGCIIFLMNHNLKKITDNYY